jgi:DNA-binding MltR family transcriptional regulator
MSQGPSTTGATSPSAKRLSIFNEPPASVKSLRKFSKERILGIDATNLHSELMEESDRASVILITGLVEEALIHRIFKNLCFTPTETETDRLFRFEGPLGTFSAKAEIACAFGFIEDSTFNQINTMRELRNAFAHSKSKLSFSDEILINVAKRIFQPIGILPVPVGIDNKSWKAMFMMEAVFVFYALLSGSRADAKNLMVEALFTVYSRAGKIPSSPSPSPDTQMQP